MKKVYLNTKSFVVLLATFVLMSIIWIFLAGDTFPKWLADILYILVLPAVPPINLVTAAFIHFTFLDLKNQGTLPRNKLKGYLVFFIIVIPYIATVISMSMFYNP